MAAWFIRDKETELYLFYLVFSFFFFVLRETTDVWVLMSVGVDEESREGAIFVVVSAVNFAPIQLHTNFISHVEVKDNTVGRVVVVLVRVLSDCTGSYLEWEKDTLKVRTEITMRSPKIHVCEYLSQYPSSMTQDSDCAHVWMHKYIYV